MNLLLDTNILIDYMGRKPPFCEAAQNVMAAGFFGDAKLWAPASSMKDIFHVLSRYMHSEDLQRLFCELCKVVSLVGLTQEDVVRAARLEWEDFEDCLVAMCAEKVKADYIITRDADGFSRSSVPPMHPKEWLRIMQDTHN